VPVYGTGTRIGWSRDGRLLFMTVSERTYMVPVPSGQPLPKTPVTGFAIRCGDRRGARSRG
jgi:hypothetical protein